ncbi:MAG TPA: hypothetical protein VEB68_13550 [Croceibacterium sp.]|nr:hypothetical protein [Croceibacterium sp.]
MIVSAASFLLAQAGAGATPAPAPPPPPACTGEEHAALDFWVGDWDVYPSGRDTMVARSRIEKLYNGCAIRENWMPLRGNGGGSLTGFDPTTQRWHQTWIGSAPGVVRFEGGPVDGKMVLTGWWPGSGPNGADGLTRMTYSAVDGGAVRQHGEFSADHGLTWQTSFDFLYRRHQSD